MVCLQVALLCIGEGERVEVKVSRYSEIGTGFRELSGRVESSITGTEGE